MATENRAAGIDNGIETEELQALILKKMEAENLGFREAKEQVLQNMKIVDASPDVKVNLELEIQKIALKDRDPNTGKFWWNYPFDFQRKLKDRYPNTNFELDDIKKVCSKLSMNGILYGQSYEYGMKYVFEKKNLKL